MSFIKLGLIRPLVLEVSADQKLIFCLEFYFVELFLVFFGPSVYLIVLGLWLMVYMQGLIAWLLMVSVVTNTTGTK